MASLIKRSNGIYYFITQFMQKVPTLQWSQLEYIRLYHCTNQREIHLKGNQSYIH